MTINILLSGAAGKMGRSMAAGILGEEDMALVAAVDRACVGTDVGELAGLAKSGVAVEDDLAAALQRCRPDVMLDFTSPQSIRKNLNIALGLGIACVVGTTGLSSEDLEELEKLSQENKAALFVAPNFALSAVLMMQFATEAVKYFPNYEIIEAHNDRKIDAPSGTALHTARAMSENRPVMAQGALNSFETLNGCRGGDFQGARIHSVRLPGVVAMQEVLFGGAGQLLSIKQESISRDGFFPGVALALRNIGRLEGLTIGLEKLL